MLQLIYTILHFFLLIFHKTYVSTYCAAVLHLVSHYAGNRPPPRVGDIAGGLWPWLPLLPSEWKRNIYTCQTDV